MARHKAFGFVDSALNSLYKAQENAWRLNENYKDESFKSAVAQLEEVVSVFEDLHYELGMEIECEADMALEAKERAEYERLKAKFSA